MASREVKVHIQQITKWNEDGMAWVDIAKRLGISVSTLSRIRDSGEDRVVELRAKRKADLGDVNKALDKANGTGPDRKLLLQGRISTLVKSLKQNGITKLEVDLGRGEAKLTYATTRTVKVA